MLRRSLVARYAQRLAAAAENHGQQRDGAFKSTDIRAFAILRGPFAFAPLLQLYAGLFHNPFPQNGLITHKVFGSSDRQGRDGCVAARIVQVQSPFF